MAFSEDERQKIAYERALQGMQAAKQAGNQVAYDRHHARVTRILSSIRGAKGMMRSTTKNGKY